MATHKECIHYRNGRCTFYNIPIDPNAPACPNFTPRGITQAPRLTPTRPYMPPSHMPPSPYMPPYMPQAPYPYWGRQRGWAGRYGAGLRMRRRIRRRYGQGRWWW